MSTAMQAQLFVHCSVSGTKLQKTICEESEKHRMDSDRASCWEVPVTINDLVDSEPMGYNVAVGEHPTGYRPGIRG